MLMPVSWTSVARADIRVHLFFRRLGLQALAEAHPDVAMSIRASNR
jgi:hypothetical protein